MNKRLCEYIGKLLLTIDAEKAAKILGKIYAQKDAWKFKPYAQ